MAADSARAPARIGIVIPAYRQPKLADEALRSALDQSGAPPAVVAAVIDGCPMPETEIGLRSWAAAFPGRLAVLKRSNGGLSAARNTGARFLLEEHPRLEAVFMLDADNRLASGALALFGRLLDEHPEADWFYPPFDMFGLSTNAAHGGPFSLLMLSAHNMCEAGSLVRRRVFEAGVSYDETMRLGYEDWDFWLSAARLGFRGKPFSEPAFRYRKRPESMLSGSHRHDAELRGYLRRKHDWLHNVRAVTRIEQSEAPRYRILFVEQAGVVATTDPLAPGEPIDPEGFEEAFWRWIATPAEAGVGAIWVVTTREAWRTLGKAGLLRFALWDLERRLEGADLATLHLDVGAEGVARIAEPEHDAPEASDAALAAVSVNLVREAILDAEDARIERIREIGSPLRVSRRRLEFAAAPLSPRRDAVLDRLRAALLALRRSRFRRASAGPADWRAEWLPQLDRTAEIARRAADAGVLYPAAPRADAPPRVNFLMTIAEFGGVEQVTANVAKAMRRRGFATTLCLLGKRSIQVGLVPEAWDEIAWFPDDRLNEWSHRHYEGTWLPAPLEPDLERGLVGLLGGHDAVIACHAGRGVGVLGALRRAGVLTVVHEHVLEESAVGRPYGMPVITLAHEAGADLIAACSIRLAVWLRAHGVPADKVVHVPNAPSYALDGAVRDRIVAARTAPSAERPLRALFLGRLDRQKGIDRLAAVIAQLRTAGTAVEWRVVGKPVVEKDAEGLRSLERLVTIEPPVHDPDVRTALYAWADVLVLPSRFEGVPLTVLEAQRCGAVPVVALTGAVDEAVSDGVDGFLVPQERCVEAMAEIIDRLAADRAELARVAAAAAARERSWDAAAGALVDRIAAEIERRRRPGAGRALT